MEIKAVVFDMDGVVLDTEKLYVRFWCEAANFYGYPMERHHALSIRSLARSLASEKLKGYFGEDFDIDIVREKRIELMDTYIAENGIELKPYAEYILKWLKDNSYKTAIATATPTDRAEKYLKQVGVYQYFDKIISAKTVKNGKPFPDIYLKACEELGVKPENALALEDSHNGIKSASSAGCVTVMVMDLDGPNEETFELTYRVVESLKEIKEILEEQYL